MSEPAPLPKLAAMKADLNKYLALKTALTNEKARIEARLKAINSVLGGGDAGGGDDGGSEAAAIVPSAPGKRHFSAATKAKMAVSQKARWANANAQKADQAAPQKPKRNISPEAKARMVAGAKRRWANAPKKAAKA